jgi:hypothetical protein
LEFPSLNFLPVVDVGSHHESAINSQSPATNHMVKLSGSKVLLLLEFSKALELACQGPRWLLR